MPSTEPYPIQEFLNYLTFQKRYSENTIISYQNDLTGFFDFICLQYKINNVEEITPSLIRTWLASLKENKSSSKTINRKISSLRSFFKYQLRMKTISTSPVATVSSLKVSRRLPSFINKKDISTLLNNDFFPDTFKGKTDFLIFEILYQTGIRRSELIHLKEKNIDKAECVIKVLGKGNKERLIPVNKQLLQLIDEYLIEKRTQFPETSDQELLINKKGGILDPKYVYNIVKAYLNKVSTNERKGPHVLRHSFATHLTNNGAPINAIKELLGHTSLAATQIYTHNTIEKLKETYKMAHPKS
ncbi:MAG: tyrosine-type recombinase/integrase [Ginsengibacter sp.]